MGEGFAAMMRQHSRTSSSNSIPGSPKGAPTAGASKGRLNFFKKTKFGSREESSSNSNNSSEKIYEAPHSDKILSLPVTLPDLERSRSNGTLSPDSFFSATRDTEYTQLRENIRRLRKAPSGIDPKKVDAAWELYKKLREDSLAICKNLLEKSQRRRRNASFESNVGPLETRSTNSDSLHETSLPFHVNEQWLSAIQEYKSVQEVLLDNIRASLLATYQDYDPVSARKYSEAFLADKSLRHSLIQKWRDASVARMMSEKLLFWEQFRLRSSNFEKLKLDIQAIKELFNIAQSGESSEMSIRDYVIAKNGDTILEFANAALEVHPILKFRVSSHLLAEASPLFAQMLSPIAQKKVPRDMINDLPPPPTTHICKDGTEVKVFQMPQIELNHNEALTILLQAAHMHNEKVPREIEFPVFVSVAEVCLRYRCTSPLELQVEYQWLPSWVDMTGDEYRDGLLLISYAFGHQAVFKRMSKAAILNVVDDTQTQSTTGWPPAVRDKIKAIRSAKLAQIHACCTSAMEEYFKPPMENTERPAGVGSLTMTTTPRCPRGSHLCDATNLGWLMLVYNELKLLPNIMKTMDSHASTQSPRRSIKELADSLRLMPSAPQVHSGVCDYATTFRSAINDIYNSVSGLTLRDVSGRSGWALSKHAASTEDLLDGVPPETHELPALERGGAAMSSNETVCLRILTHLDDLDDLSSAAMIDKRFYNVYKRNEATLLRNVMKAERRRTMSSAPMDMTSVRNELRQTYSSRSDILESAKYLVSDNMPARRANDLYDVSPPRSPMSPDAIPMSAEEAERILWPESIVEEPPIHGMFGDNKEKFLLGDVAHIEDKARIVESNKHLRDETDIALGLGINGTNGHN